jgi:membrane associated rhomboid family serine protease
MVGFWFLMNLLSGVASFGSDVTGGVAFFAHVGGFLGGLVLVRLLMAGRPPVNHGKWSSWRAPPRRVQGYYR